MQDPRVALTHSYAFLKAMLPSASPARVSVVSLPLCDVVYVRASLRMRLARRRCGVLRSRLPLLLRVPTVSLAFRYLRKPDVMALGRRHDCYIYHFSVIELRLTVSHLRIHSLMGMEVSAEG